MKISYTYLIVIILSYLLSCSTSEVGPEDITHRIGDDCVPIPASGWDMNPSVSADTLYYAPDFNPENCDQFMFIKGYYITKNDSTSPMTESRAELWTYDRGTKAYSLILEHMSTYPRWGPEDWIIFSQGGGKVWKVKSNGDSLTKVTDRWDVSYPSWHPDGELFVARVLGPGRSNNFSLFHAQTGQEVDSFPDKLHGGNPVWSNDGHRISAGHYIYDFRSLTSRLLTDSVSGPQLIRVWSPDDRYIFWVDNERIFRTEVETGQTITLRDHCSSQAYGPLDIHPEGDHLLVTRYRNSWLADTDTVFHQVEIVQLDLDGNIEEVVFPPPGSLIKYN